MARALALAYGVAVFLLFDIVFLYFMLWLGNLFVQRSIDRGLPGSTLLALVNDLILLGIFAIQHSEMARPAFKRAWSRVIPAPVERSTYVLAASLVLALAVTQWRSMPKVVWSFEHPAAVAAVWAVFWLGWAIMLAAVLTVNVFDFIGLRQVWLFFRGKRYTPVKYTERGPYRHVRHPIMLGFALAFWAAPVMTQGRLLFALVMSAYILLGIWLEERDLLAHLGAPYRAYRKRVPMLLPWRRPPAK